MKKITLLLVISICLFCNQVFTQEKQLSTSGNLKLSVHNFCQPYSLITVSNGDSSAGIHPSFGYMSCISAYFDNYEHLDSLLLFNDVKYVQTDQAGFPYAKKFFCIGNQNIVVSYLIDAGLCQTPNVIPVDTLHSDSISGITVANGNIIIIRNTNQTNNLIFYDSLFSSISFSTLVNTTPKFIATDYINIAIAGVNDSGQTTFTLININTQNIFLDTILGSVMTNPFALTAFNNYFTLTSSPADTGIFSYTYGSSGIHFGQNYSGSNANVFCQHGNFQPESDTSNNNYDEQLFIGGTSVNINMRLKYLMNPHPELYHFDYLLLIPDTHPWKTVYYFDLHTHQIADTLICAPNLIWSFVDWGCPMKITEYDDSKVEWTTFPNPTSENASIIASGLICGKNYELDIIDIEGKLLFKTEIHAKMKITLPIENYPPGIYLARIHTLKGIVTQKIIKN